MAELPTEDATTTITVDVSGLADLAEQLRVEVNAHLRPYLPELVYAYRTGVQFGRHLPSGNLSAVAAHYNRCLAQIVDQLDRFARAGLVLADAAALIAKRYGDADALSGVSLAAVNTAITAATGSIPQGTSLVGDPSPVTINGQEAS